jgi:endonuclease-3
MDTAKSQPLDTMSKSIAKSVGMSKKKKAPGAPARQGGGRKPVPAKQAVDLKKHAAGIVRLLRSAYPDAKCSLSFTNPLELLVATVLSAQCTYDRENIFTKDLIRKIRNEGD